MVFSKKVKLLPSGGMPAMNNVYVQGFNVLAFGKPIVLGQIRVWEVMSCVGFCWLRGENKLWHFMSGLHWYKAQFLTSSCPGSFLPHAAVKHCISEIYSYIANTVCFTHPAAIKEGDKELWNEGWESFGLVSQKFSSGLLLLPRPKRNKCSN